MLEEQEQSTRAVEDAGGERWHARAAAMVRAEVDAGRLRVAHWVFVEDSDDGPVVRRAHPGDAGDLTSVEYWLGIDAGHLAPAERDGAEGDHG